MIHNKFLIGAGMAAIAFIVVAAFLLACGDSFPVPENHASTVDSAILNQPIDTLVSAPPTIPASEDSAVFSDMYKFLWKPKEKSYQAEIRALQHENERLLNELKSQQNSLQNSYDSLLSSTSLQIAQKDYFLSVYADKYGKLPNQP